MTILKGRTGAINLSPAAARYELPNSPHGLLRLQQVDRPPLVLTSLPVPCACGRPLVAQEYAIFGDDDHNNARGSLFVRGVCVACGIQTAIFAPPAQGDGMCDDVSRRRRITDEVNAMVAQVLQLRLDAGAEPETVDVEQEKRTA